MVSVPVVSVMVLVVSVMVFVVFAFLPGRVFDGRAGYGQAGKEEVAAGVRGGDPPGVGTVSGQTDGRCNGALAYAGHRGWIDGDSAVKG